MNAFFIAVCLTILLFIFRGVKQQHTHFYISLIFIKHYRECILEKSQGTADDPNIIMPLGALHNTLQLTPNEIQ